MLFGLNDIPKLKVVQLPYTLTLWGVPDIIGKVTLSIFCYKCQGESRPYLHRVTEARMEFFYFRPSHTSVK